MPSTQLSVTPRARSGLEYRDLALSFVQSNSATAVAFIRLRCQHDIPALVAHFLEQAADAILRLGQGPYGQLPLSTLCGSPRLVDASGQLVHLLTKSAVFHLCRNVASRNVAFYLVGDRER
jgi:hypothetical protein